MATSHLLFVSTVSLLTSVPSNASEHHLYFHYTHRIELDGLVNYEGPLQFTGARWYIDLTDEDEPYVCEILVENVPEDDPLLKLPLVTDDGDEILFGTSWMSLDDFEQIMRSSNCRVELETQPDNQ